MTEAWREERLLRLAHSHELRRRLRDPSLEFEEYPPPRPCQVALLQIFIDVLCEKITPVTAAKQISDWVLSVPDTDICYDTEIAYFEMFEILLASARQLSSQTHLKIMADLTVELANLPDVYNNTETPMEFDEGLVVIQPGEKVRLRETGETLWSGLPLFSWTLKDNLSMGPSSQFRVFGPSDDDQQRMYLQGEDRFTNINTFAALIAQQHPPQGSELCICLPLAITVFNTLEYGPDSPFERYSHLAVRAAAIWLEIAGERLMDLGMLSTKYDHVSGSLWEAEGGTKTVDVKRLRFWKDRFRQLRESGRLLSQEALNATNDATTTLDRLIASRE